MLVIDIQTNETIR